jgi:GntR family carbon starvation induced transcriptional regulator
MEHAVSVGELDDVTEPRTELSVRALERSIRFGDDDWESRVVSTSYRLRKLIAPMTDDPAAHVDDWERRNREFHATLESACGSPWLLHFTDVLYDQSERFRRRLAIHGHPRPEIDAGHEEIMEAALRRDAETACAALGSHVRTGGAAVRAAMLSLGA